MKVIVITNQVPPKIKDLIEINDEDYVIVVDGAFDSVLKQKIKIDLVVGDFDSVKNVRKLKKYKLHQLEKEKDETDTKVAIDLAYTMSQHVILIGGIQGNRIEHFLANLTIFKQYNNLLIIDNNSKIYLLSKGKHLIEKNNYISFFGYNEAIISLENFKYPLKQYQLNNFDPLCISNEVNNIYGEVHIYSGQVIVIETKK